jgi:hypothetical protein
MVDARVRGGILGVSLIRKKTKAIEREAANVGAKITAWKSSVYR